MALIIEDWALKRNVRFALLSLKSRITCLSSVIVDGLFEPLVKHSKNGFYAPFERHSILLKCVRISSMSILISSDLENGPLFSEESGAKLSRSI